MKPTLALLVPCLCLFLLGCATVQNPAQPTYQDLATESLGLMDQLAASMTSLSDPGSTMSAAKAMKGMKGIMKKIGTLNFEMKALDAPSADVQSMFQQQMMAKQAVLAKSMIGSMMSALSNPGTRAKSQRDDAATAQSRQFAATRATALKSAA